MARALRADRPDQPGPDQPGIVDGPDARGAAGDRLGFWARFRRTGDPARGPVSGVRLLSFAVTMSVAANVFLAAGISTMLPLKRDVPYLLQVSGINEAVAEVRPLRLQSDPMRLVAEKLAMRYVRIRHEIVPDFAEMNRRWGGKCLESQGLGPDDEMCGFMIRHSTPDIYRAFHAQNAKEIQKLIETGINRRVAISLEPIALDRFVYEIRFSLQDFKRRSRGDEPELVRSRHFVATVWVGFAAVDVKRRERFVNPLGFQVTRYELAEQKPPAAKEGRPQ